MMIGFDEALARFRRVRAADTHKGQYGRILLVAGSEGMTGAALLCASAALHMGAGLVCIASPRGLLPVYETALWEAVKRPIGAAGEMDWTPAHVPEVCACSREVDVAVVGPGLGSRAETAAFVRRLLRCPDFAPAAKAVILDADGLNAYAQRADAFRAMCALVGPRLVITPHEGEAKRLLGEAAWDGIRRDAEAACGTGLEAEKAGTEAARAEAVRAEKAGTEAARAEAVRAAQRRTVARCLAERLQGGTAVLKGSRTVCCRLPARERAVYYCNETGNAGMATAGSGDVLAGMMAGLAATEPAADGAALFDVACMAVLLHGLCGDLCAACVGQRYMTARDIIEEMGELIRYDGKYTGLGGN